MLMILKKAVSHGGHGEYGEKRGNHVD